MAARPQPDRARHRRCPQPGRAAPPPAHRTVGRRAHPTGRPVCSTSGRRWRAPIVCAAGRAAGVPRRQTLDAAAACACGREPRPARMPAPCSSPAPARLPSYWSLGPRPPSASHIYTTPPPLRRRVRLPPTDQSSTTGDLAVFTAAACRGARSHRRRRRPARATATGATVRFRRRHRLWLLSRPWMLPPPPLLSSLPVPSSTAAPSSHALALSARAVVLPRVVLSRHTMVGVLSAMRLNCEFVVHCSGLFVERVLGRR